MNYNKQEHLLNLGTDEEVIVLIKEQWESFKLANGRYPTTQEIDVANMVSSRTIQRRFGGVGKLRKQLGHETSNYSSGYTRSKTSANSMARSLDDEQKLSTWLIKTFGDKPNVIIEERYLGHSRHRADCGIYHKGKHFFVDIFSAKDKFSLSSCINFKQKKINGITDETFFVSSNPDISQELIDYMVYKKKNKLPTHVKVLTLDNFKKFCLDLKNML